MTTHYDFYRKSNVFKRTVSNKHFICKDCGSISMLDPAFQQIGYLSDYLCVCSNRECEGEYSVYIDPFDDYIFTEGLPVLFKLGSLGLFVEGILQEVYMPVDFTSNDGWEYYALVKHKKRNYKILFDNILPKYLQKECI